MNFVGHAAVARRVRSDPRWILGSMLPDFASMSGTRIVGANDPDLTAGIVFHHRTDDVFHRTSTFVALQARGTAELKEQGLGRGPARAVAHVGPELLIDGLLLDEVATREAYLRAVTGPFPRHPGLRFARGGEARLLRLLARLRRHGVPADYRRPDQVGLRLVRMLAGRPRLALATDDLGVVVPWLEHVRTILEERLPRLMSELLEGLGLDGSFREAPSG